MTIPSPTTGTTSTGRSSRRRPPTRTDAMLFDLRGRGRRRTIQGIYLFLAILLGGGLIFFGVGGTGIGLFNNNNGSGGGGYVQQKQLKAAERQVRLTPQDPKAWASLARIR